MKKKYFNLSIPIKIKEFEEFKNPFGWLRLNKYNIELKSPFLTIEEINLLNKELKK